MSDDPFDQFAQWFLQADEVEDVEANAMTVATVNASGRPSARILLLKEVTDKGFVFYSNFESRKGKQLAKNPYTALVFHWPILERQVRIEGRVTQYDEALSTKYYRSRPKGSQIGAWSSPQSQVIPDRAWLEGEVQKKEREYMHSNLIPKPPFWGGYICIPDRFEFWQGRSSRLHDRISYRYEDGDWVVERLAP